MSEISKIVQKTNYNIYIYKRLKKLQYIYIVISLNASNLYIFS